MTSVYLPSGKVAVDPARSIGKGGEADVYRHTPGLVLKIYKQPNNPDYANLPHEQDSARVRLDEHQTKLPSFPSNLPERVVAPLELARERPNGRIVGYTMRFLEGAEVLRRYAEKSFRQAGVDSNEVVEIFRDLRASVRGLHDRKVVVGDFNDLNVLVKDRAAWLIDADSFQFGPFQTRMFTMRFVDPLRCDPNGSRPILCMPHNEDSDWYSFHVLLFQSLLYVDPYGGVYRPKTTGDRIPHDRRPLKRVTVFHKEVRYPKPAVPYDRLPDDLLQRFHEVFEKDRRGEFPEPLLANLRWTNCAACGVEHARDACPACATAAPARIKEKTVVRGTVTSTRIFRTEGVILHAALQRGRLAWLYHEDGAYRREDGLVVSQGDLDPRTRYRLAGPRTLLGRGGQVVSLRPGAAAERLAVDSFAGLSIFDTNERHRYWIDGGRLQRDGEIGPEYIGDVLAGQTLFWVGPMFGFGFYRAGELSVAFVFDAQRRGINDSVRLPRISGHLLDSVCYFSDKICWFLTATREAGRTIHRCLGLDAQGQVLHEAQAEAGDGSWLGTLRGKCAAGGFLLSATDDGVVRVDPAGRGLAVTKEFPDTEPFVDEGCHLFPGKEGLYVTDRREVRVLKIG